MASYLKIKCFSCGESWNVYGREADRADTPPRCPFCQERMRPDTWGRLVNSLFTMEEANKHLRLDADEKNYPLFQAEIRSKFGG